ncbi:hypothetical protein H0H93_003258, partial [Arthromyces matolae]
SVSAHYIWYKFDTSSESTSSAIRQPTSNSPVTDVTSNDITCNINTPATETVTVPAGSFVGFELDNTLYHQGFSAIYLGKAPSTAASWDGSGANWFKIAEWGATFTPTFAFVDFGWSELNTTIPANTPPGDYLLRVESVGLHVVGAPQWYISCAQITVTGSGTGSPTKVSIPGYVQPDDPYLMINIYYPTPTAFVGGADASASMDLEFMSNEYVPEETNMFGSFSSMMGLSFLAPFATTSYIRNSISLFILGTVLETGRRSLSVVEMPDHVWIEYRVTAQFAEGDPSYEWIILFLTEEKIWRGARDFRVSGKNSQRKWGLKFKLSPQVKDSADYVPTYEQPQLFRWKGYWIEVKRTKNLLIPTSGRDRFPPSIIYISIYTLDMNVLHKFVEDTRQRYLNVSRPNVTVHMADGPTYGSEYVWNNIKHKSRRPLNSIILSEGVVESLVNDTQEFLDTESWYAEAGIPYRRGYLLYGPPGTGKNIDCAFPSREESMADNYRGPGIFDHQGEMHMHMGRPKSLVSLSGLLNVIDGIGSEEGRLFFATTNYIDRIDPALLRPGRVDKKVEYKLSTKIQAHALFMQIFSPRSPGDDTVTSSSSSIEKFPSETSAHINKITDLATRFAAQIPDEEFSTAELQGFLLAWKRNPEEAVKHIGEWVVQQQKERKEREDRESERKARAQATRDERKRMEMDGAVQRFGNIVNEGFEKFATGHGGMVPPGKATDDAKVPPVSVSLDTAAEASSSPLTPESPASAYEPPNSISPSS